ncbi:MAG: thioesterase family protein [Myxococcota bacterium]
MVGFHGDGQHNRSPRGCRGGRPRRSNLGDFEVDTRLEGSGGHYRADLSSDWEIWGPNGGYLAAIALRAAGCDAQIPRPASFAGHFLSIARFASVDVRVRLLRRGRRSESFQVTIAQDGKLVLEALVRTAASGPGLEHDTARPPDVPGPEELVSSEELSEAGPPRYPFWQNLEVRPIWPERFREEPRVRPPIWREWYRFRPRAVFDDPFVDAGRMLLLIDTLSWPAAVQAHPDPAFQATNLDVSAWFHTAEPGADWLLADHECPVAQAGLMGTQGRVWSADGRLLASGGAQLICVPTAAGSR